MATEELSVEVLDIARRLYGVVPRIARLASNNNFVFRLELGSALPAKVMKLPRAGQRADLSVWREQQTLRLLSTHGIAVPAVEFTQDDLPGASTPFTIMPSLPGTTLEEACRNLNVRWASNGCRWTGAFIHRLCAVPAGALPVVLPGNDRSFLEYVRRNFDSENLLVPPFSTILEQAQRLLKSSVKQLIHGDYSWGQIITDGGNYSVIDWESVTVGHPLNMLGRAMAMAREYGGTREHIDGFVEGYEQEHVLTEADRRDLHLWEMWHHVGCMGWKFVLGPDHRAHAFAMAERVRKWAEA